VSWQDRELARVKREALDPRGLFRPDAPLSSLLMAGLAGLGVAALMDLLAYWTGWRSLEQLILVDDPHWYAFCPFMMMLVWWSQRRKYLDYASNRSIYDDAAERASNPTPSRQVKS
jgi:hypothetical protein